MEESTRMWLATGAAICGVLAAIGWAVAIYAFTDTPEIHEVIVKAANGGQSNQSKAVFLFVPAACQTFLCWMLLNPIVRWKHYIRRVAERMAPNDMWVTKRGGLTFPTLCRLTSAGVCVASGVNLYWAVERASYLIRNL